MFPYMSKIELGSSSGSQSGDCAHEVAGLGDRVNYYHDSIFLIEFWQFNYKINTDSVPRCIWNWEGVQFSGWWLANGLSPETMLQVEMYLPIYLDICGHQ